MLAAVWSLDHTLQEFDKAQQALIVAKRRLDVLNSKGESQEMDKQITDGGPAFPETPLAGGHPGMSLRDYFAGQVISNILRDKGQIIADNMTRLFPGVDRESVVAALTESKEYAEAVRLLYKAAAVEAYAIADAMLAQRAIPVPQEQEGE